MRCPEYALKCNKSVHLPAWLSLLCVLGDLSVIWAGSTLGDFPLIEEVAPSPNRTQIIQTHNKDTQAVSEHFYCISVYIPYVLLGNPELYDPTDTCRATSRPTVGRQSGDSRVTNGRQFYTWCRPTLLMSTINY